MEKSQKLEFSYDLRIKLFQTTATFHTTGSKIHYQIVYTATRTVQIAALISMVLLIGFCQMVISFLEGTTMKMSGMKFLQDQEVLVWWHCIASIALRKAGNLSVLYLTLVGEIAPFT